MTRVVVALSKYAYYLIIILVIGGLLWASQDWILSNFHSEDRTNVPVVVSAVGAFVGIITLSFLAETHFPLRALSLERWIWSDRPRGKVRSVDGSSLWQVVGFGVLGSFLGATWGQPLMGAASALAFRVGLQAFTSRNLAGLLRAGRTRMLGSSPFYVMDSELVADVWAETEIRWRPKAPTSSLPRLAYRRFLRRPSLPLAAVSIIALAPALGPVLAQFGIPLFCLAWCIYAASLKRICTFERMGVSSRLWIPVVIVHALVGGVLCILLWNTTWWLTLVIFCAACLLTAHYRSKPRLETTVTQVETGFGVGIPMELINYHCSGLQHAVIAGIALTWFG